MASIRTSVATLFAAAVLAVGCGGGDSQTLEQAGDDQSSSGGAEAQLAAAGVRSVSVEDGATLLTNPPDNLVILDVRTPEEFAEGHIEGATMIDFYRDDFADQIAELDPDVPYLLYCRSGNRSGQTAALMERLGFADVADVDGGVLSWGEAGLPLVTP